MGQGSALLDAMTNQQITDFGAQMAQWAGGQANQGAMAAGQSNLNAQTSAYNTNVGANASMANARTAAEAAMANARTAANASMYNAKLSSAASMFGYGAGMMGDASSSYNGAASSLGYANGAYGDAGRHLVMPIPRALTTSTPAWVPVTTSSSTIRTLWIVTTMR